MALFRPADRRTASIISNLVTANPFLPERIEREREALGSEFDERDPDWNLQPAVDEHPNVIRICARAEHMLEGAYERLTRGVATTAAEGKIYKNLVLYYRYRSGLDDAIWTAPLKRATRRRINIYTSFAADVERYLGLPGVAVPAQEELAHVFPILSPVWRGVWASTQS